MPLYVPASYIAATSSVFTPAAASSNTFYTLTGNSITLTPGSWMVSGTVNFGNGGSSPSFTNAVCGWSSANGAFTALTVDAGGAATTSQAAGGSLATINMNASTIRITVSANTTIFLVPLINATTTDNARITTYIYAEKLH